MPNHLFIDLEALGQKPGCAPIELGAVVFDPQTGIITDEFHRIIKPHPALKGERDTLDWHAERGSYPFTPARYLEAEPLAHAIADFFAWLPAECESVWSWGSTYDFPVLDHALAVIGKKAPWHYAQQECARTVWRRAFGDRKHSPRPHHALEDCRAGVRDLCEALAHLKYPDRIEETWRADAGWARADELSAALNAIRELCPGGEIGDPEADVLLSRIEDIASGALEGRSVDRWRPIATAPKEGRFLVWLPTTGMAWPANSIGGVVFSNAHGTVNLKDDRHSPTATHWMPMPDAPGQNGGL